MRTSQGGGVLRLCFVLAPLVFSSLACNSYTGVVKKEFVREDRVDEVVLRDEVSLRTLASPAPGKAYLEIRVDWDLHKEYRLQTVNRVYREFYPFSPAWEILEILSSPFLFLTALPTSILVAPVELAAGTGEDDLGKSVFAQMFLLPFRFLNPGANADDWAGKDNVYGKKAEMEDLGLAAEEKGPVQTEERTEAVEGAQVRIEIPELGRTFDLKTASGGRLRFPLNADMARISQEGKGMTLKIRVSSGEKSAEGAVKIPAETLEEIYERLMLD